MKNYIVVLSIAVIALGAIATAHSASINTVVDFLYDNGMTKFDTVQEFRADASITRGESAKFIAQYADAIDYSGSYDGSCEFGDTVGYDSTLTPHIAHVCSVGLIKGSNGNYFPNNTLTQAEALTILMRSQTGFEDETTPVWYDAYFARAQALGLVTRGEFESVATTPISRGRLGLWIYMIMNPESHDDDTIEDIILDIPDSAIQEVGPTDDREVGTTMNVRPRPIGATMNVTVAGEARRDGFQPFTNSQFQNALRNNVQVVLYFRADGCPSCQLLTTALEAEQFAFPEDLLVLSIYFDEQADLVSEYGVTSQHTLIYLDTDGEEITRSTGQERSLEDIEAIRREL